jgi:RNA-binding protein NOB1
MHAVINFARKTGDLASLSQTDMRVVALTLTFEREINGLAHLRNEPLPPPTVPAAKAPVQSSRTKEAAHRSPPRETIPTDAQHHEEKKHEEQEEAPGERIGEAKQQQEQQKDKEQQPQERQKEQEEDEGEEDDDEGGWITPDNIQEHLAAGGTFSALEPLQGPLLTFGVLSSMSSARMLSGEQRRVGSEVWGA